MTQGTQFLPSRTQAWERLNQFLPRAGKQYSQSRNFDLGPENRENISLLSPYLRRRLLLEEEVVRTVLAEHSFHSAEKFLQEVFWRTYWKGWLEMRPQIWDQFKDERKQLLESHQNRQDYLKACQGETGIEAFDAWVDELKQKGYLHNHARMWFASIWIFTLELPWQLGADFFFRHLLDGDPASNTLGWRWVAGIQTSGKNYVASRSNISKFTENRFSPTGLAEDPQPLEYSDDRSRREIPQLHEFEKITNQGRWGLLLTPEDLSPEKSPLGDAKIEAIFAGLPLNRYQNYQIADPVFDFTLSSLQDSLRRAEIYWNTASSEISKTDRFEKAVEDWANNNHLDGIVSLATPVGPWNDIIQSLDQFFREKPIQFVQIRRNWDQELYPLATRGFFPFKKKIPEMIEKLGLN